MSDVVCANCGHSNQAGANFCSSCGQPIERPLEDPPTITFSLDADAGEDLAVDTAAPTGASRLVVTRGPNTGSEFTLEDGITTAGRHPDSDIFLDDVTVSRRHVELQRGPDGTVVRDVGSLNGTYLNQQRIEGDKPIANADELQVGKFKLLFLTDEAGRP